MKRRSFIITASAALGALIALPGDLRGVPWTGRRRATQLTHRERHQTLYGRSGFGAHRDADRVGVREAYEEDVMLPLA